LTDELHQKNQLVCKQFLRQRLNYLSNAVEMQKFGVGGTVNYFYSMWSDVPTQITKQRDDLNAFLKEDTPEKNYVGYRQALLNQTTGIMKLMSIDKQRMFGRILDEIPYCEKPPLLVAKASL
jgi:hypothetical protein